MPSGLKVQNDYQTHHHHHRGQIDHTIITFTHPQGTPSEPAEPYGHLFSGSEGIVGPPLPGSLTKNIQAVERLLYGLRN